MTLRTGCSILNTVDGSERLPDQTSMLIGTSFRYSRRVLARCFMYNLMKRPTQFNFGLHDLMKTTPELLALYTSQLTNITRILLASGAKHVQYALTTPFQADALEDCGPYCSPGRVNDSGVSWPQPTNGGNGRCGPPRCVAGSIGCGVPNATAKALGPDPSAPGCGPPTFAVTKLNQAAVGVMQSLDVPMLDLNGIVHSHCGTNYSDCELCDDETKYMGIKYSSCHFFF